MPTLDWIGKRAVLNHHREIPFHLLKENGVLSAGSPESGNLLVQGDNLLALKALLPHHARQVKLICVDPPGVTAEESAPRPATSPASVPAHRLVSARLSPAGPERCLPGSGTR